jgi:hypothetical protein
MNFSFTAGEAERRVELTKTPARTAATKNARTAVVLFILVFVWREKSVADKMDRFAANEEEGTMQTNYNSMYLADLKLIAKTRRIKMYYIKTKDELVTLLNMPELPQSMKVEKMTIHQLRKEAKARNVSGFWNLRRGDLVKLLFPENVHETTPNKDEEDHGKADKHHQPEEHDPKEVGV